MARSATSDCLVLTCRTDADLYEAIVHGLTLYRMEVLDDETVSDAVNRVIAAVELWGDNMVTMGGINAVN